MTLFASCLLLFQVLGHFWAPFTFLVEPFLTSLDVVACILFKLKVLQILSHPKLFFSGQEPHI